MGVGAGLYMCDVVVKSSRSLSHLLMSSCLFLRWFKCKTAAKDASISSFQANIMLERVLYSRFLKFVAVNSISSKLKFLYTSESYFDMLFNCCCPSACLSVCLSVTIVHPTQALVNLGNFLRHLVPWPSADMHRKFYGHRLRETPPSGELNPRAVAKYSDFKPIEGYISETVQDTT